MARRARSRRTAETVRLVTWNLMHTDLRTREERTAEAAAHLKAANPDVVLLQEVASGDGYNAAADLAAALGMTLASQAPAVSYSDVEARDRGWPVGHRSDTAILTRLPVTAATRVGVPHGKLEQVAVAELVTPSGRPLLAISVHLDWRADQEHTRLRQAMLLDGYVRRHHLLADRAVDDPAILLLGGDLNATADGDVLRYLTGRRTLEETSTFWVDAWVRCHGEQGGATVVPANPIAREIATRFGITRPERLPERRIDYLLVHGWVYGKPGDPVHAELIGTSSLLGGSLASDHYGLLVELADPK